MKPAARPADEQGVSLRAPPRDSAFAVIARRSTVLLVRARGRRRWQLPGGLLKRGETPREAAGREVEEETGLVARILVRTGTYLRPDGSFAFVFTAAVAEDAEPSGSRNEIRQQRWIPSDEALGLLPRRVRRRLADALAAFEGAAARRSLAGRRASAPLPA